MKYRTLGRTGFKVSEVSLGGAGLAGRDPERAQESATSIVRRAAELGINYIDTAPYYGKSEELLGPALASVDHKFYVATKLGLVPKDFDYTSDSVLASIERSLKRLGLDKLDVAQIHEVNHAGWERITDPGGALEGLRKAQDRGLCDKIGVTGRAIPLLTRLAETDEFDTLLFYHDYHPCQQKAAEELIPAAAAHHMGIVAATVLAGGLYVPGQPQQKVLAQIESEEEKERVVKVLEGLEDKPGTLPQKAFRYVLDDDRITTVASGAANPAELEEVAQAPNL